MPGELSPCAFLHNCLLTLAFIMPRSCCQACHGFFNPVWSISEAHCQDCTWQGPSSVQVLHPMQNGVEHLDMEYLKYMGVFHHWRWKTPQVAQQWCVLGFPLGVTTSGALFLNKYFVRTTARLHLLINTLQQSIDSFSLFIFPFSVEVYKDECKTYLSKVKRVTLQNASMKVQNVKSDIIQA